MDINAFSAAKAYGAAQQALRPDLKKQNFAEEASSDFETASGFKPAQVVEEMTSALTHSEKTASDFMVGKADPHSVVEALASAELAVETAVTLRDKVVEAYQELMRMPV